MIMSVVSIEIVNGRIQVSVSVKDGNESRLISKVYAESVNMRSVVNNSNGQISHTVYAILSEGEVGFNADIVIYPDGFFKALDRDLFEALFSEDDSDRESTYYVMARSE